MLQHVTGDLFTVNTNYIAHGVNTCAVMGAGIAKVIAQRYPALKQQYVADCRIGRLQPGGFTLWYDAPSGLGIFNLASQDRPGRYARQSWLESSLAAALDLLMDGTTVAMPWIGAGIGGLTRLQAAESISSVAQQYPAINLIVVTASFDTRTTTNDVLTMLLRHQ